VAVLLLDLDETLVDRSEIVRQWATDVACLYPNHVDGLADWLVDWDATDSGVRERREFLSGVRERLGLSESVDALLTRWPTEFCSRYLLDQATRLALQAVRDSGVSTVIVTNGATERQQAKLSAMDVLDLVDGWVISEQVGVRKPDRRIFEIAAESVGHPLAGSWVVGDDPILDVGAATDAGLGCVWVNRHQRTWDHPSGQPPTFHHPARAITYAAAAISARSR
jgi:putative hydrolase of the HAD superfamily